MEQSVEWIAGGVLIVLCSLWLARELGMNRRRKVAIAVWVGVWLASVALSIIAIFRAEAVLGSVPPNARNAALAKWIAVFETAQTVSRLTVAVGCLLVFVLWLLADKRSNYKTGSS